MKCSRVDDVAMEWDSAVDPATVVLGTGARPGTGLAKAVGVALRGGGVPMNDGMRAAGAGLW